MLVYKLIVNKKSYPNGWRLEMYESDKGVEYSDSVHDRSNEG